MKPVRFLKAWMMYQPGETAGFPKAEADALVKSGHAVAAVASAAVSPEVEQSQPVDPNVIRATLITDAIMGLDREQHFTQDGKPEVSAINALLSPDVDPVSADERDELWAKIEAAQK